jgi:predicted ATP-dependent endonuclease of OLD family
MKLVEFRVQKYKCFEDSGWISIDNLTVLVGKNEAGKTSLLKALHKLNPFVQDDYLIQNEWPRGDRRKHDSNQIVCSGKFKLEQLEIEELETQFQFKIIGDYLVVSKNYNNEFHFFLDIEKEIEESNVIKEVKVSDETTLLKVNDTPIELTSEEFEDDSIPESLDEKLESMLPTFIYMSDYRDFSGSSNLEKILERKIEGSLSDEDKTIIMIMELSGLDVEQEVEKGQMEDREQRQFDLDDASNTLTGTIEKRWKQKQYEVQFRADGPYFYTYIKDSNGYLIRLEERSKGFQWFFSFDLMFMYESQGTFKNCVILLDEPGLHLHPEGQQDLLQRLESYANENTLIYSTHLPFMINLERPESIRVISETEIGTRVTEEITETQKESKFVLQAALGISGRQSFLLSNLNLVVEGVDDFWILSELSGLFKRNGKVGFLDDIFITPAGGASEAVYITTFMIGQQLKAFVLLDSDKAGVDAKNKLETKWLTKYQDQNSQVSLLNEFFGGDKKAVSIEDIFPEDYYLEKVLEIYKAKLPTGNLQIAEGDDLFCKRIERHFESLNLKFNKGSVAKLIRKDFASFKTIEELPEGVSDKFEKIVKKVNSSFS